jgi:hypothetical protein
MFIARSSNKTRGTEIIREHRTSPLVDGAGNANTTEEDISMNTRLMMSVAAVALIAGTGFANAQGSGMSREAPIAQRTSPSAGAPMNRNDASDSGSSTATTGQSDEKTTAQSDEKMQHPGGNAQRAQQDMKAGPKGEKSAQESTKDNGMKGEKSAQDSTKENGMKQDNMRGESSKSMSSENEKARDRNDNMNAGSEAESKSAAGTRSQTVGQAGAGAKLSSEQRTKITTVIRDQHIAPVNNVNFSISVGTRVPRDVSFHPLPAEIVTIYPDWRGYEFILVRDQIVVVNPQTFEIVAVIDA